MSNHTPGKWANIKGYIVVKSGHTIASVNSHNTTEGKANANLIAAAPKLLEALIYIRKNWPDSFAAIHANSVIADENLISPITFHNMDTIFKEK